MRTLAISLLVATCFGLSACAGLVGPNGSTRPVHLGGEIDYGKVIAVNQWAERRGATVLWINYPVVRDRKNDG